MKEYLLLDTGSYALNVIEITSNERIELTSELLELVASECIKNDVGIDFIIDTKENTKDLFNEYEEIEGYTYLDLSCNDIDYNIYLRVENMRFLDEIPKTYNIDLKVEV